MDRTPREGIEFVLAVVTRVREVEATFLAAAVAYYAFVSLLPLLVLTLVVGTAIAGEAIAAEVVGRAASVLSPTGEEVIRNALTARGGRGGVGVIGTVLLVWGALKVVRGLALSVGRVYETDDVGSVFETVARAAVTLGIGAIAVAVTAAVIWAFGRLAGPVGIVATLALPVVLIATFVSLYVLLPTVDVTIREALPGAVVATVAWMILGMSFGLYTAVTGTSVYGVLGGVLLLVTWLYLGALVLIVGAIVNALRMDRNPIEGT